MTTRRRASALAPQALALLLLATALLTAVPGAARADTPKGVAIDASFTGAWFDPTHRGEGFLLQILDNGQALTYWFTYDGEGEQLWVVATGTVSGNRIDFVDGLAPRGARFGSGFDPDDVELGAPWGSWSMTFSSCDAATLEYRSVLGDGTQTLQRLSSIDGIGCAAGRRKVLNGSMTGAWFDLDRIGEGFLIDVIGPDSALVYWFTYDLEGDPFWVTAVGTILGNRIEITESFATRGGIFGDDFDPATVELLPFGPMAFAFDGTGSGGALTALGPEGFDVVDMRLTRLTQLQGTAVTFDDAPRRIRTRVGASDNLVIDGDVNDPNVPATSNDQQAQPIPNPSRVAGFASATGSGRPGSRFAEVGDPADFYRLRLAAGQALALDIADHEADDLAAVDLDLVLIDASGETVAASNGIGPQEEVTAPSTGDFTVGVIAFAGASNYTLATGNPSNGTSKLNPFAPMLDKEAIVRLREGGKSDYAARLGAKGLGVKAGDPSRELLIDLAGAKDGAGRLRNQLAALLAPIGARLGDAAAWETVLALKAAAATGEFSLIEPNHVYRTLAIPSDSNFGVQWHYPKINLPQAWDLTVGDPNIIVAVIDSGVAPHPDNANNVDFSLGIDTVSSALSARDGDGVDRNANDPGDQVNPDGSGSFHGTHVAGTVAADSNNGATGQGLAGTAWNVTVMPVRALGKGGRGSTFDIIEGFRWATGQDNVTETQPARVADVVNMSLGGAGASQVFQEAITAAREAGVIVIAAAGNGGRRESLFPASYDGVVSVSASTISDELAPYSSFGQTVDIAAPGGDTSRDSDSNGFIDGVFSLLLDDSVSPRRPIGKALQGTSMASPHVAGVAALMKSVNPNLSPVALDQALARGELTVDLNQDGPAVRNDRFGFGRIDALRAVAWALEDASRPLEAPVLRASNSTLLLDALTDTAPLTLDNAGGGDLALTEIFTTQPWLSLRTRSVDAGGIGAYEVTVDRSELPTGRFQGVLTFVSNGGNVAVTVAIDVGAATVAGEIGTTYLLAIDPLTFGTLAQVVLRDPSQRAALGPLLSGDYLVAGGTDLDNDGFVCDDGELCGAFPTLSEISAITLGDRDVDLGEIRIGAESSLESQSTGGAAGGGGLRRTD